jgi:hypothetical protein
METTSYVLKINNKVLNKSSNIPHLLGVYAVQGRNPKPLHNSFYSNGGNITLRWQPIQPGREEYSYIQCTVNGELVQLPVTLPPDREYNIEALISYTPRVEHVPSSAEIEAIRQADIANMHARFDAQRPKSYHADSGRIKDGY